MGAEIQWVLGFAMALVGAIGGFITRDRQVHNKIVEVSKEAAEKVACLSKEEYGHQHHAVPKVELR